MILLLIAVISIPVMLLVKPFYIRWRHNRGLPVDLGHGGDDDDDNHEVALQMGETNTPFSVQLR